MNEHTHRWKQPGYELSWFSELMVQRCLVEGCEATKLTYNPLAGNEYWAAKVLKPRGIGLMAALTS